MNHILLITEDSSAAGSLRAILGSGFLVEECAPRLASSVISGRRPAAIFLDSCLGGVDSRELLKSLAAGDPALAVIKIVPSSGISGKEATQAGAFEVIEKPFDPERIKHIVNKALEREKIMRENRILKDGNPSVQDGHEIRGEALKEDFFEDLFQTVAENFPDIKKMGMDVLKILRKKFYFNNIALFLREEDRFMSAVSLGIDGKITGSIKVPADHPVIKWFTGKNRILNIAMETDIPYECFNFMGILNCRLAFPLKTINGKLIGFLAAGNKFTGQSVSISEMTFLNIIADYLATIMDNAFLYREITFQKDYQEAIFQNIPTGIIAVGRDGRILIFNAYAEEIFGLEAEEVKHENIEKAGSQVADFIRRTLGSGQGFTREEIRYIPRNIILGISTNVIRDAEGATEGAVAIFQNLTKIKEMEEKEKSLEKSRYWAALASRLSHELKNPLVAIKTFSQMLPTHYEDEEFRTSFSEVVQKEIEKINGIIDKINKLADSMELRMENIDIADLFRNVSAILEKSRDIKINIESKGGIFVSGDMLKLKEAIEYAFDFICEDTGKGGEARISFNDSEDNVEVTITENGSNIGVEKSEDFFMPFNPSVKSPLSIGVMLAKKILESHGGSFLFNCVPGGKKLTFIIPRNNNG